MPKKASPEANPEQIRDKLLKRIKELYDHHVDEFMQVLEESESRKMNVTFRASIDKSETAAKLQTHIAFSQVVKDAREDVFDDPNQPPLIRETAPRAGKKSKTKDFVPPMPEPDQEREV